MHLFVAIGDLNIINGYYLMMRILYIILGLIFHYMAWAGPTPEPVVAYGVEVQPANVSCAGMNDGSFRVTLVSNGAVIVYEWSSVAPGTLSGIGTLSTNSPSDLLDSLPPGDYLFRVLNFNGVDTTFGASIVEPPPLGGYVKILSDYSGYDVACFEGPGTGIVRAEISGGVQGYSYVWSNGSNGSVALDYPPGQHDVRVFDGNGCYIDMVFALDAPPPLSAEIVSKTETCLGQGSGLISVLTVGGGVGPYTMVNGNLETIGYAAAWDSLSVGVYAIKVEDSNGCMIEEMVELSDGPAFFCSAGPDTTVFSGDTLQLSLQSDRPLVAVSWSPARDFVYDTLSGITRFFPFSTSDYMVQVQDENGCHGMDTVRIAVQRNRSLYFPNVFAPDGNNPENQFFSIYGDAGVHSVTSLRIFDRFGRIWFDQTDIPVNAPDTGWRGDAAGERAAPGVYFWQAVVLFTDERVEIFQGDVTLVR
ncbi:MAG: gliding motility-associated C-terminal domain-containing protein [Saprospiraceae bacterium]|nr:gliding motility-associated C-terminal domain-containing protein [Saprospiraceae bacterium]